MKGGRREEGRGKAESTAGSGEKRAAARQKGSRCEASASFARQWNQGSGKGTAREAGGRGHAIRAREEKVQKLAVTREERRSLSGDLSPVRSEENQGKKKMADDHQRNEIGGIPSDLYRHQNPPG